jgi:hypothetical protein
VTCYTQPCNAYEVICLPHYLPLGDESSPRGRWSICAPALPEVLTTLPERGQMTSTTGSHGNIKSCRGVHVIDYALLDGKSGTEVLQKHPHHPIGSCGAREGYSSRGLN